MNTLAELDEEADRLATPARATSPEKLAAAWFANGFYTLSFPDGSHKTFRVRTDRAGIFAGKRTLAVLIGPQNTDEYEPIAFLQEEGFHVWRRYRGSKLLDYAAILWDMMKDKKLDGYEVRVSKRCLICNRVLTTPESVDAGIGPECASRGRKK
jgi:hypothetical protein